METTVTVPTLSDLDARQKGVLFEAKLVEWKIEYDYDPAVPLAEIHRVTEAQVREDGHLHHKETTEEYAAHMRAGVVFPPVILYGDSILVDGNTRLAAAKSAGLRTLPAFKCRFPNPDLAKAFAAAMNQMGGRRLTPEEARTQAEVLMRYDYEDDAIARELGYGRTRVNEWRRDKEARSHAERTRVVEQFEQIPRAQARKLADIKLDAPFAAVTSLVAETKLPAKKLTELVGAVKNAPTEADALDAVGAARAELQPAGPPPARSAISAEYVQARRVLPQIVNLEGRELSLVEHDPERRDAWITKWRAVQAVATKVLELHRA